MGATFRMQFQVASFVKCKVYKLVFQCILWKINVKVFMQVMRGKYNMRGMVKWQIQHKAKPSAVFDIRPHPNYYSYSFCTSQVNSTLLIYFLHKEDYWNVIHSYKKVERQPVSAFLLYQEYEMDPSQANREPAAFTT